MRRPRWSRRWIPGIVFWVLFLGSIALDRRHPLIRTVWVAAWLLLLLVVAVISVVQAFRHRDQAGGVVSYRGVPLWLVKLWGGGAEPEDKPHSGRPL